MTRILQGQETVILIPTLMIDDVIAAAECCNFIFDVSDEIIAAAEYCNLLLL